MIIVPFILIALSLLIFSLARRQRETVWLAGIFVGFVLINTVIMLYYAKMGGLNSDEQKLFFIFPSFKLFLQNAIIPLNHIALMASFGHSIYLYFTLIFSLDLLGLTRRRWIYILALLWPLLNIILGNANFFLVQPRAVQTIIAICGQACTWVYLAISVVLLLQGYLSHTIRWVKRQMRYIILSIINLNLYYLIFCQINPFQIISQNIYPIGLILPFPYRLRLSVGMWVLTIGFVILIFLVGCISLYKYTKITLDENKENMYMERQIDTAGMGVRVFIHGIKNQLLAQKIVLERMNSILEQRDVEDDLRGEGDDLRLMQEEAARINQQMSRHIEALYNSFKIKSLSMKPCYAAEIVKPVVEKYAAAHPNIIFTVKEEANAAFLADWHYVAEALENLLSNAVDAIQACGEEHRGEITVIIKADNRWCAIRVDDNGVGMSKDKLGKVFKPFFTDKNTGTNWGIGLSSVRQTVRAHFGQVHANNLREQQGACFIMAFPRVYPDNTPGILSRKKGKDKGV